MFVRGNGIRETVRLGTIRWENVFGELCVDEQSVGEMSVVEPSFFMT